MNPASGGDTTWRTLADPAAPGPPSGDGPLVALEGLLRPPEHPLAGRYLLGPMLGSGGFGSVHLAEDMRTRHKVAVKLLPASNAGDLQRVRRELAALRHANLPGVVRLLDDGVAGDVAWIVMEHLPGEPFLASTGRWQDVQDDVRELLRTLVWVHLSGLIHGDLKPGNVVAVPGRGPVLVDFGIARGRALDGDLSARLGFSRSYAAPEIRAGRPPTVRSDLYSIGVMLFEWLSGTRPTAWSDEGVAVPSLAAVTPVVPPVVAAVVDAMVAEQPEARPASALEVLLALGGMNVLDDPAVAGLPVDGCPAEDLRRLFHGPDRLLHLPTDAAQELWLRTEGRRERVAREIAAWMAAGLCWWDAGRVRIDRRAVQRLAAGVCVAFERAGPTEYADVRALVDELLAGAVDLEVWQRVHRTVRRLRLDGRRDAARLLVDLVLDLTREGSPVALVDALLTEQLLLALGTDSSETIRQALYELERRPFRTPLHEALWSIARGAAKLVSGARAEARPAVEGLAPFEDEELEVWRVSILLHGRDTSALGQAEDDLLDLAAWAAVSPARQARWQGWLGGIRYQQGRFEEAAILQEAAARARRETGAPWDAWLASRTSAAVAWLDAGRADRALQAAREVATEARARRHASHEAMATWVERSAAARRGEATEPDLELVEAAFAVSRPRGAELASTEAVIAWRNGHAQTCRQLIERALEVMRERGSVGPRLVMEALQWALGPRDPATADRLLTELESVRMAPGLRAQVLGLVVAGRPELQPALQAGIDAAVGALPPEVRGLRREVLSLDEAAGTDGRRAPGVAMRGHDTER